MPLRIARNVSIIDKRSIDCSGIITRRDDKEDRLELVRTRVPRRRLIIGGTTRGLDRDRVHGTRKIEKRSTPIAVDLLLFGYHPSSSAAFLSLSPPPPCSHLVLINRLFMFNATRYPDRRRKFSKLSDGNRGSDVGENGWMEARELRTRECFCIDASLVTGWEKKRNKKKKKKKSPETKESDPGIRAPSNYSTIFRFPFVEDSARQPSFNNPRTTRRDRFQSLSLPRLYLCLVGILDCILLPVFLLVDCVKPSTFSQLLFCYINLLLPLNYVLPLFSRLHSCLFFCTLDYILFNLPRSIFY